MPGVDGEDEDRLSAYVLLAALRGRYWGQGNVGKIRAPPRLLQSTHLRRPSFARGTAR